MSAPQDPIRQQLIEARRAQILAAAAAVFAEKGFHRATTKEIAKAAGVSEGTIYNYFGSKDDLLIGIMARLAESQQLDEMLEQALPSDPRDFFSAMLRRRQDFVQRSRAMLQAVLSEILINREFGERYYQQLVMPAMTQLEQHVQARIGLGQIRPVNASLAARILFAINAGLLVLLVLGDPVIESEWNDLVEMLAIMLFDGVGYEDEAQEDEVAG
jgi:TetR/AcrR family fatty acid metabolism transcriptional regulator